MKYDIHRRTDACDCLDNINLVADFFAFNVIKIYETPYVCSMFYSSKYCRNIPYGIFYIAHK